MPFFTKYGTIIVKLFVYNLVLAAGIFTIMLLTDTIADYSLTGISLLILFVILANILFSILLVKNQARHLNQIMRSFTRITSDNPDLEKQGTRFSQNKGMNQWVQGFLTNINTIVEEKNKLVEELLESRKLLEHYSTNLEDMVEQRTEILKWLAITDPLTGLYNRRYFMEQLEQEFKRSRRYERDLSLLMLDIDYFKRVNDTYGHQVGDLVLRKISSIIEGQLRDADLAFRFGGEEFMVILPETSTRDASNVAERMRTEIMHSYYHHEDAEFNVTVSIGIISMQGNMIETVDSFLKKVDDNLYIAKNRGRNKIVAS